MFESNFLLGASVMWRHPCRGVKSLKRVATADEQGKPDRDNNNHHVSQTPPPPPPRSDLMFSYSALLISFALRLASVWLIQYTPGKGQDRVREREEGGIVGKIERERRKKRERGSESDAVYFWIPFLFPYTEKTSRNKKPITVSFPATSLNCEIYKPRVQSAERRGRRARMRN